MNTGILKTLVACTAISLTAGGAFASSAGAGKGIVLTDEIEQHIRSTLTDQGYEVAKIKIEDGLYEAYARKDGQKIELLLNADLEIVKTEAND